MNSKKEIQSATFPDCPIRNVISHITDKWSLLVLYTLEQKEVLRFKDLWRQIPDISQKMLTSTLRHLARKEPHAAFGRIDFMGY